MILTGFQFRAARKSLNKTIKDLSSTIRVSQLTLFRLDSDIKNNEKIKCSAEVSEALNNYFIKNNLEFPNDKTITLNLPVENRVTKEYITRFQLICSRVYLQLSHQEMASTINIPKSTYTRIESVDNCFFIKHSTISPKTFISFFSSKNIFFPDNNSITLSYSV